jgi:signal transduction histidine kinase
MAKTNANEIIVNIDDRIPEYLIGDKLRLQIIMNLVSNGKVHKNVNLAKVENNFIFLELKIQDNGIGIDPLDQEKILINLSKLIEKKQIIKGLD